MALPIVLNLGVRAAQAVFPRVVQTAVPFTSKQVGAALGAATGVALHPMLPGPPRLVGVTETYDIDPQAGRPNQTSGRALPTALQNTRQQGYQSMPTAQLRLSPSGKPADAAHTQTHTGGLRPWLRHARASTSFGRKTIPTSLAAGQWPITPRRRWPKMIFQAILTSP